MIALLCPTRGRPEQCKRMLDSAYATAHNKNNIKPYFAFTLGDGSVADYKIKGKSYTWMDYPTAYKWNKLAQKAYDDGCELFMLAADDMIFDTIGWDRELISHYKKSPQVFAFQDSRDVDGTPHPIVTREWMDVMGYFVPPIFSHWFIDSWTVSIAKAAGVFTHLRNVLLIHNKPSDKGIYDDTHNRIRSNGYKEQDEYINRVCQPMLEAEKARLKCACG